MKKQLLEGLVRTMLSILIEKKLQQLKDDNHIVSFKIEQNEDSGDLDIYISPRVTIDRINVDIIVE